MSARRLAGAGLLGVIVAIASIGTGIVTAKPKHHSVGKVKTVKRTVTVPAGKVTSKRASCPKHTNLVGGGFAGSPVDEDNGPLSLTSKRTGKRAWKVTFLRPNNATGTATGTVYAYCRRGAPKLSTAKQAATVSASGGGLFQHQSATAVCPGHGKAAAGGFELTPIVGPTNNGLIYLNNRQGNGSWIVSAANSQPSTRTMTAYVYCSRKLRPVTSGISVSTSSQLSAGSKTCPGNKTPLAGGFETNLPIVGGVTNITEVVISKRTGKSWLNTAYHVGTPAGSLTSSAYCG